MSGLSGSFLCASIDLHLFSQYIHYFLRLTCCSVLFIYLWLNVYSLGISFENVN